MTVIPILEIITAETSSAPVSGHTALWCLVSLGLTSMVQPSVFASKRLKFSPARISPFVCLAETLIFPFSTIYLFYSGSTPSDSVAGFVQLYYQQDRGSSQLWLLQVVAFLLNALPQMLTLCGMHGVPWTKTWGFILFFGAIWDGLKALGFEVLRQLTRKAGETQQAAGGSSGFDSRNLWRRSRLRTYRHFRHGLSYMLGFQ
jgi:hypothetical protein